METTQRYFYGKANKLKSRKLIQKLFAEGKSITVFPIKAIWLNENAETSLQTGVSVSSRYFKKAVDRNRIKRLVREAYRLQKNDLEQLLEKNNLSLSLFLIYTGKELPDYKTVFDSCNSILKKLIKAVDAKN